MSTITFKGRPIQTTGTLPAVGTKAPAFKLTNVGLEDVTLDNYAGKKKILSIFPSLDTPTCATSVRKFNERGAALPGVVVLNISRDLPFAQKRFCGAEGIQNVEVLSSFRSTFGKDYGVEIVDMPFTGLCSRAIVVLNEKNEVLYTQQVPEIAQEPDYENAILALGKK